jgi:arginine utilization protein RocB
VKDPARPNLVARLKGAGDSPPLLLQGHVDVVTTSGQEWQRPPFGGDLVGGEVWGRGAVDMKGAVAMFVSAFLRAARGELELPGDVILVVLSDEEKAAISERSSSSRNTQRSSRASATRSARPAGSRRSSPGSASIRSRSARNRSAG